MTSIPKVPRPGRWALRFLGAALLGTGALAQGTPGSASAPAMPAARSMSSTAIVVSQFVGVAQGASRDSA